MILFFAVGYKGGMVEEYFGDGSRFGIRARYAYEEELLGTAGAIKNAGKYVTDEQFFVLNGDTFYQMDFGDLSRIQQEKIWRWRWFCAVCRIFPLWGGAPDRRAADRFNEKTAILGRARSTAVCT